MRRAFAALCSVGLLLTMLAPGVAAGGPPEKVTITSTMWSVPNDANQGTFAVEGTDAICAHGQVFDVGYVFGAYRPGHLREILVTKAFVCTDDDVFLVRMQVHEDLAAGTERFTWVILKGFGAFRSLHGQGSGYTTSPDLAIGPWFNTYDGFVID